MISRRKFVQFSGSIPICMCCGSIAAKAANGKLKVCTELAMKDFSKALDIAIDENPDNDPSRRNLRRTEAIALYSKKWHPSRRRLSVSFLQEPTYLDKVIEQAKIWNDHMGMQLRFGTSDPDILVAFQPGGSWSYIGTDSRYFSQRGRASMNFGWFNASTTTEEFKRTTLHEFGHALALVHEHQHPGGEVDWNRQAVYDYYASQGWGSDQVDRNIFAKYKRPQVNGSQYDQTSIMHYPIPNELVSDSSDVVGWNTELSSLDEQVIERLYPKTSSNLPEQ